MTETFRPRHARPIPDAVRDKLNEHREDKIGEETSLYELTLMPDEANLVFHHAKTVYQEAKNHPYGRGKIKPVVRVVRRHLAPEHKQRLVDEGIGLIMPLTMQSVVQADLCAVTNRALLDLNNDIMVFAAKFRNSGIKLIKK